MIAGLVSVLLPVSSTSLQASTERPVSGAIGGLASPDGLDEASRLSPPAPPPPPPAPPAPQQPGLVDAEFAASVIRLTNVHRANALLPPLATHHNLVIAATDHAMDQYQLPCTRDFLSHVGSDGTRAVDRILRTGLSISRWAENIACAHRSAESVVAGWMRSPAHRHNVLNPLLTHIGVAVAESSDGIRYWVQVFATLR